MMLFTAIYKPTSSGMGMKKIKENISLKSFKLITLKFSFEKLNKYIPWKASISYINTLWFW